jgi:large subunit ribosomal protein L2
MRTENKLKKLKGMNSSRHRVVSSNSDSSLLSVKKLVKGKMSKGGRNNLGRITCRHQGGGHKQKYRSLDFLRSTGEYSKSKLFSTDYDPTRTSSISRYYTKKFNMFYTIGVEDGGVDIQGRGFRGQHGVKRTGKMTWGNTEDGGDDSVHSLENNMLCIDSLENNFVSGNTMRLRDMPVGYTIHNIQSRLSNKSTTYSRAAGTSCVLLKNENGKSLIKLPSKHKILLD